MIRYKSKPPLFALSVTTKRLTPCFNVRFILQTFRDFADWRHPTCLLLLTHTGTGCSGT